MPGTMTAAEITKRYGVTRACVTSWRQKGYLPDAFWENGWRYPIASVRACIKARKKWLSPRRKSCRSAVPA